MANEIRTSLSVAIVNGNYRDDFRPGALNYTQVTASGGNPGSVSIGTAEEDIAFGDVTPGLVMMQNLDTTNFVKFGPKSAGSMVLCGKISPGKIAYFELGAAVTLRMQADTAACLVLIKGLSP